MNILQKLTPLLPLSLLAAPVLPCTAFLVCGGGAVLMGNNEDYWDPETRIWFVPADEGQHGRVYLGYKNMFPQGGMNEKGLAFDGFATERNPITDYEGKEAMKFSLLDEVMATCTTVEEVMAAFSCYDLRALESAMLMFADSSGDSVIIEGDDFVRKEGTFQVVTNFYQSRQEDDRAMCPRFDAAVGIFEEAQETSLALCRRVLARTAQERGAPTQYSNVFDLKKGLIYLYHFHNFEEVVVLDLQEELAKGEHVLEIPSLFPKTFAFASFLRHREIEQAKERAERQGKPVDPKILDEYAGEYEIDIPAAPKVSVIVWRDGKRLLASSSSDPGEVELIPESDSSFFYVDTGGTTGIRFERDEDGAVDRLVVIPPLGEPIPAIRKR